MVVSDSEKDYNDKEVDELPSDLEDGEDENGLNIGERLVAPNATMYTTAELHSMLYHIQGYRVVRYIDNDRSNT